MLGPACISSLLHSLSTVSGRAVTAPELVFVLRRTTATGKWIGWHVDTAGATVQVPLGDVGCVGGKLVYVLPDGVVVSPPRSPGVGLAHHGDVVHGVTRLVGGVRYGLFALVGRG